MSDEDIIYTAENLLVPQDGSEPTPERVQWAIAFSLLVIARNSIEQTVNSSATLAFTETGSRKQNIPHPNTLNDPAVVDLINEIVKGSE